MYEKTNELVEKYSRIGIFVMKHVMIPSIVFPIAMISMSVYFTTDLKDEAFKLPFPAW